MSFKTYSKILPVIFNSFKATHVSLNRPLLIQIGKSPLISAANLYNINLNSYSTKPRTEIKQVYYGPLTPQIKAVKVSLLSNL